MDLLTTTSVKTRTISASDRRRYFRAYTLGALGATAAFMITLVGGRLSLLQRTWRGNFYDLQAHSLLSLKWDVPRGSLAYEGFLVHGKTYMYFGAWPALMRLPVAAVTRQFDGRLTQLSMLLAWVLILIAVGRLAWQVRAVTTGDRPLDYLELWLIGGFVVMIGLGTPVLYLATRPMVYHEAVMWGLAWTLLSFSAVIGFSVTRSRRQLLLAAAGATGAMMSRASLGVTAVLAVGLLAVAATTSRPWRSRLGLRELELTRGDAVGLGASCLIALTSATYVNLAKFGTLWSTPFTKRIFEMSDPVRLHNLRLNGGSFFGLKFIPTTLVQYLRPDAIALHFPWPTFAASSQPLLGVRLQGLAPTSSVVDSMLIFSALGLIGFAWILRWSPDNPSKHIVVIPLLAAIVGSVVTLSFGYLAQRYVADFIPLIVLLSLIGLNAVINWLRSSTPATRQLARVGLIALALANVWVSVGFAREGDQVRHSHDIPCVVALETHTPHPRLSC
jgi:hypothetical protein